MEEKKEIYELVELGDCPLCEGPGILEECDHGFYAICMDCGNQTVVASYKGDEDKLDAAKKVAELWNTGKVVFTGRGE